MSIRSYALCAVSALAFFSAPALAATETFDSITIGAGGWTVDRYAPYGFEVDTLGGDNRLLQKIRPQDGGNNRPAPFAGAFYNTQGYKLDLAPGTTSASIDLYIDPTWSSTGRMAGFWATGVDGSNAVSSYPIIEFNNGGFRVWDSNGLGSWTDFVGAPTGPGWQTLIMRLNGGNIDYTIGGQTLSVDALGTTRFSNVILQGYNTQAGTGHNIYWDNLATPAVPEPATWAMMIGGFALVGSAMRRRRTAVAFA